MAQSSRVWSGLLTLWKCRNTLPLDVKIFPKGVLIALSCQNRLKCAVIHENGDMLYKSKCISILWVSE